MHFNRNVQSDGNTTVTGLLYKRSAPSGIPGSMGQLRHNLSF